jgi:hypothetical protein
MTEEEQVAALCPLTVTDHDIGVSILIWKTANGSHVHARPHAGKDPEMEITAPVVSNIVCFRYKPRTMLRY